MHLNDLAPKSCGLVIPNLALANFERQLWSLGEANLERAMTAARQMDNESAELMIMTLQLTPLAHTEEWARFDEILTHLLGQGQHEYAQIDCADALNALIPACRAMNQHVRVRRLDLLNDLQHEALGI